MESDFKQKSFQIRLFFVAAVTYWVIVVGVWGIFALSRGLNYETIFPLNCQIGIYECLIYGDNLRPYNSLFLGAAHIFGLRNGSYISYQLLYGLLWWARGLFVFLIVRQLVPLYPLTAFILGALSLVHTADGATNWVGQIHQLGFLLFLAIATYCLLKSWTIKQHYLSFLFLALALIALHITLWTYESQYFIILVVPVFLWFLRPKFNFRLLNFSLAWYALPTVYGYLQLQRYVLDKSATYQSSIARSDFSAIALLKDLFSHLNHTLTFWQWGMATPGYELAPIAPLVGWLCAISFLVGACLLSPLGIRGLQLPTTKSLVLTLFVGVVILLLSFPIYLLLAGNTNFWRTQMLAVFGFATVAGAVLLLLAKLLVPKSYQALVAVGLCAAIIFCGVRAGVIFQGFHGYRWQIHQHLMAQVLQIAPGIKNHTLILLVGLPKEYDDDPFGASMWFDAPVRLLYPHNQVVGHFIYVDGTQPTDNRWTFTDDGIKQTQPGYPKAFDRATYGQILALRYEPGGKLAIAETLPKSLLPEGASTAQYAPLARIETTFPPSSSFRMFAR